MINLLERKVFSLLLLLLIDFITSNQNNSYKDSSIKEKLNIYINKPDFNELNEYLNDMSSKKVNFSGILKETIDKKIFDLKENVNKLFEKYKRKKVEFSPAFSWSENSYEITLEIYFSRTRNGNSCGELEENKYELKNNKTFYFEGKCVIDDEDVTINLNLNLFKEIDKIREVIIARKQATFKLTKKINEDWLRLLDYKDKKPYNMYDR